MAEQLAKSKENSEMESSNNQLLETIRKLRHEKSELAFKLDEAQRKLNQEQGDNMSGMDELELFPMRIPLMTPFRVPAKIPVEDFKKKAGKLGLENVRFRGKSNISEFSGS
mmetsp:Transcript_38743/g.51051  ORF Transcript_38743/g.51051 Transcript_38743/m.51051 type:complete len:111 (-) Transcript_38743:144-476(-)